MFLPQTKPNLTKQKKHKRCEETCGCDEYVYYLDCGDSHMGMHMFGTQQIVMKLVCVGSFVYQLFLIKAVF